MAYCLGYALELMKRELKALIMWYTNHYLPFHHKTPTNFHISHIFIICVTVLLQWIVLMNQHVPKRKRKKTNHVANVPFFLDMVTMRCGLRQSTSIFIDV